MQHRLQLISFSQNAHPVLGSVNSSGYGQFVDGESVAMDDINEANMPTRNIDVSYKRRVCVVNVLIFCQRNGKIHILE